jgi:sulfite reductase alpha subunit-like flavoprotein
MAKRNLKLDIDSLFDAMKEVYRDCDEQKKAILEDLNNRTQNAKVKAKNKPLNTPEDFQDEMELAKYINESRKVLNDVIEKKVKLISIHSKVVTSLNKPVKEKDDDKDTTELPTLSSAEIKKIKDDLIKQMEHDSTYDLNE